MRAWGHLAQAACGRPLLAGHAVAVRGGGRRRCRAMPLRDRVSDGRRGGVRPSLAGPLRRLGRGFGRLVVGLLRRLARGFARLVVGPLRRLARGFARLVVGPLRRFGRGFARLDRKSVV